MWLVSVTRLGYMKRGTTGYKDVGARKTLYLALVRNHFTHVSQVWSPQSVQLIKQLESVQRRATQFLLSLPYDTSIMYKDRLLKLNLLPLSYWHEYLDSVFLYKLASGMLCLKLEEFLKPQNIIAHYKKIQLLFGIAIWDSHGAYGDFPNELLYKISSCLEWTAIIHSVIRNSISV